MESHRIEANLLTLNEKYKLPYIPELIERKITGKEKQTLDAADMAFHKTEFERLIGQLKQSAESTSLPDSASGRPALDDLLKRLRLTSSP
jgi:predicted nucleotidyltransferase